MNSKSSFIMGLVAGLGVMFTIGFFILLSQQGGASLGAGKAPKAAAPAAPTAAAPAAPEAPSAVAPEIEEGDHILGSPDAEIVFIEFSDIQCPFCQRFHPTVQQIVDEYPGQIAWVYKHFPLDSIHPQARTAAEASECAAEQLGDEGFFQYLEGLFAQQSILSRDLYISEATKLGANQVTFTSCLDSGKYKGKVDADYQAGIAAGVRGTPSSFINGRNISGALPYEQVKATIDALLGS